MNEMVQIDSFTNQEKQNSEGLVRVKFDYFTRE